MQATRTLLPQLPKRPTPLDTTAGGPGAHALSKSAVVTYSRAMADQFGSCWRCRDPRGLWRELCHSPKAKATTHKTSATNRYQCDAAGAYGSICPCDHSVSPHQKGISDTKARPMSTRTPTTRTPTAHIWFRSGQLLRRIGNGTHDVRVARIGDGENRAAEQLAARCAQRNVVARVMVDAGLREHRIILDLRLAQRRAVAPDEHKLGCDESSQGKVRGGGSAGHKSMTAYFERQASASLAAVLRTQPRLCANRCVRLGIHTMGRQSHPCPGAATSWSTCTQGEPSPTS